MNLKRLAKQINPDLDLSGCYPIIVPRIHRAIPHMDRLASLITGWFDGRDVILMADDRVEPWLEVVVSNMEKSDFVLATTSRKLLLDRRARQENKHERN